MKKVNLLRIVVLFALSSAVVSCGGSGSGGGATGTPGAISWEAVSTAFSQPNFIDFGANGHWFVADRSQGFFRSTDSGATWSPINSGIATNFGWTINVVPSSGDLIAGIYSSGGPNLHPVQFYRSTDEGSSWTMIQSSISGVLDAYPAWSGCAFASNGNAVCGGYWASFPSTGGWYSTNGGQTVAAARTVSSNGTTVYALALNPVNNDLWMGTEQYGIFRSTDNGATWTSASPPDTQIDPSGGIRDGNIYAITFDRSGNVLFGSQGGIWKSSSSGSAFHWTNVKGNPTTADGIALARDATGMLYYGHRYASGDPTSVYCSADSGGTWQACDRGLPKSQEVYRMAVNPSDGKMYATVWDVSGDSGKIYRTVKPVQ